MLVYFQYFLGKGTRSQDVFGDVPWILGHSDVVGHAAESAIEQELTLWFLRAGFWALMIGVLCILVGQVAPSIDQRHEYSSCYRYV